MNRDHSMSDSRSATNTPVRSPATVTERGSPILFNMSSPQSKRCCIKRTACGNGSSPGRRRSLPRSSRSKVSPSPPPSAIETKARRVRYAASYSFASVRLCRKQPKLFVQEQHPHQAGDNNDSGDVASTSTFAERTSESHDPRTSTNAINANANADQGYDSEATLSDNEDDATISSPILAKHFSARSAPPTAVTVPSTDGDDSDDDTVFDETEALGQTALHAQCPTIVFDTNSEQSMDAAAPSRRVRFSSSSSQQQQHQTPTSLFADPSKIYPTRSFSSSLSKEDIAELKTQIWWTRQERAKILRRQRAIAATYKPPSPTAAPKDPAIEAIHTTRRRTRKTLEDEIDLCRETKPRANAIMSKPLVLKGLARGIEPFFCVGIGQIRRLHTEHVLKAQDDARSSQDQCEGQIAEASRESSHAGVCFARRLALGDAIIAKAANKPEPCLSPAKNIVALSSPCATNSRIVSPFSHLAKEVSDDDDDAQPSPSKTLYEPTKKRRRPTPTSSLLSHPRRRRKLTRRKLWVK